MSKIYMSSSELTVRYDNTFNETGLTLITNKQADVFFAVLSMMDESNSNDDGEYYATIPYKAIREITNSPHLKSKDINRIIVELLDTKVAFIEDGDRVFANVFSEVRIHKNNRAADVILTKNMTNKLKIGKSEYTSIEMNEFVGMRSIYSKEFYRLLKQFESTGVKLMSERELLRITENVQHYSDKRIIDRIILPSIEDNRVYFDNLEVNINPGDTKIEFPIVIRFTPKSQQRTYDDLDEEERELLEYIEKHTV